MLAILAIAGALIVAASVPLILGRVPRNDFYGLRTPRTMSGSLEEWYRANRTGGIVACILGLLLIAGCAIAALMKQDDRLPVLLGSTGLLVAGTIAVAVKFWK
jgi:hypothetical protein